MTDWDRDTIKEDRAVIRKIEYRMDYVAHYITNAILFEIMLSFIIFLGTNAIFYLTLMMIWSIIMAFYYYYKGKNTWQH